MPRPTAGRHLRDRIATGRVIAAGAFNPFVARLVEAEGFDAVYISGAALANSLALPDEGVMPRARVLSITNDIVAATSLPVIVDVDTGFGGPSGTARTVELFEDAGAAAIQVEDQDPRYKRCGHLEGKRLIASVAMVEKVRAAKRAKSSRDFIIIARTDSRAVEGFDAAVKRAQAYEKAGADAIFPEALTTRDEFEAFRKAVSVPLVANMTEYGKTPWMTDDEFVAMGYAIVLHPATMFRVAAQAIRAGLQEMKRHGNQQPLVDAGRVMNRQDVDRYLIS